MADTAVHSAHPSGFAHQFEDMDQQRDADSLGMWVFLVTEVMFFGGLFATYIVYRSLYLRAFEIGSHLLKVDFGAVNTAILIGSSLTMALAIHAAQSGKRKTEQITFLVLTMILGAVFLFLKFNFEWRADYAEHLIPGFGFIIRQEWGAAGPHVPLFFLFYFFMTGLHAVHMIIGIGILIVLTVMAYRNRFNAQYYAPLEVTGLYWHFVDIVWIFLFPLLYLIGGRYPVAGGH
ncbi:MAG: cytochrome c oxidase subunit 3 [Candidatus Acidiferrales bacterium]